jgi:hypothetical protein
MKISPSFCIQVKIIGSQTNKKSPAPNWGEAYISAVPPKFKHIVPTLLRCIGRSRHDSSSAASRRNKRLLLSASTSRRLSEKSTASASSASRSLFVLICNYILSLLKRQVYFAKKHFIFFS